MLVPLAYGAPSIPREGPLSEESDSPRADPDGLEPGLLLMSTGSDRHDTVSGVGVQPPTGSSTLAFIDQPTRRVRRRVDLDAGNAGLMHPALPADLSSSGTSTSASFSVVIQDIHLRIRDLELFASSTQCTLEALSARLSTLEDHFGLTCSEHAPRVNLLRRVQLLELASRSSSS